MVISCTTRAIKPTRSSSFLGEAFSWAQISLMKLKWTQSCSMINFASTFQSLHTMRAPTLVTTMSSWRTFDTDHTLLWVSKTPKSILWIMLCSMKSWNNMMISKLLWLRLPFKNKDILNYWWMTSRDATEIKRDLKSSMMLRKVVNWHFIFLLKERWQRKVKQRREDWRGCSTKIRSKVETRERSLNEQIRKEWRKVGESRTNK